MWKRTRYWKWRAGEWAIRRKEVNYSLEGISMTDSWSAFTVFWESIPKCF
jgi:hypothetical protein